MKWVVFSKEQHASDGRQIAKHHHKYEDVLHWVQLAEIESNGQYKDISKQKM